MRHQMDITQNYQLEALYHSVDLIFWVIICMIVANVLMCLVMLMVYRDSRSRSQDWFKTYHEAYHDLNDDQPLLPPKSLASKSGHAVIHEPIVVPPAEDEDFEVHSGDTTIVPIITGAGRHRA